MKLKLFEFAYTEYVQNLGKEVFLQIKLVNQKQCSYKSINYTASMCAVEHAPIPAVDLNIRWLLIVN
jgi:hypothetical protein